MLARALALLLSATGAALAAPDDASPAAIDSELSSGPFVGGRAFVGPTGHESFIRVREHTTFGDRLRLSRDLGINVGGELQATLGWRFDRNDALRLDVGFLFLWGSERLRKNVTFNSATFQGRTGLSTVGGTKWLVLELRYERTLVRFLERGSLQVDLGARFDYLDWRFPRSTLAPGSGGKEAGEGFGSQATPIPVVGLTLRVPIAPRLDLLASGRGFRADHWDSQRKEGGRIFFSQSFVDGQAGLVWSPGPGLEVACGYRVLLIDLDEVSAEDGNRIQLLVHGAFLGTTFQF